MLEIKRISKDLYKAIVNNQQFDSIKVSRSEKIYLTSESIKYGQEDYFTLFTYDRSVFDLLISFTAKEIPKNVDFVFEDLFQWREFPDITLKIDFFSEGYRTRFDNESDLKNWDFIFSFSVFQEIFSIVWNENYNYSGVLKFDERKSSFHVDFISQNLGSPIENDIRGYLELLQDSHTETIKRIRLIDSKKSITLPFQFPEELKISCEQYLLYFATFLQDIGIKTTSNLKEEAGKVLFSVTPIDDIEALDKIREALVVYLNLPASPVEYNESFVAMRLLQQVENLQHSQRMAVREIRISERELRLAQTVIEHQDKIILQKDSIIGQKDKIIEKISSKSIMMDSLEKNDEFEIVCDGLEFTHSKWLLEKTGIKSNPVTLLKSLGKKLTGKDNEITSINLTGEADDKNI